ncbi:MAG TPA: hypothetical protein VKT78_01295 [Fimbriimonadaceae bacterium]|nr:hypothetical protein [Fimbriimonadaceae bacterium]
MNRLTRLTITAVLAGLGGAALAQPSYDTYNYWLSHSGTIGGVGAGAPNSEGQSFFTPTGGYNTLVDFSFWMFAYPGTNGGNAVSDTFSAEVYRWDGTNTIGAALQTVNLGQLTLNPFSVNPTQVEVNTNVSLTPGDEYMAVLTDVSNNSNFYFGWVPPPAPGGDGGGNVVYNDGIWRNDVGDMAWHADFSRPAPTPEPFTVGLGLAGIGLAIRRRLAR